MGPTPKQLENLVFKRRMLDKRIAQKVAELHRAGVSWGVIGKELGMTRQGARYKFAVDRTSQNEQL